MATNDIIGALRRFDFDALFNTFLSMPPKQQTITLAVGGVLIFVFTVVPFFVVMSHLSGLEDDIAQHQEQMNSAIQNIHAFRQVEAELGALEKHFAQQSADSLLTVVKRVAEDSEVRAENSAGKGEEENEIFKEERLRFHVKQVELPQLVKFLHELESTTQRIIRVKKVKVTPVYGNRTLLNADFSEVSAYSLVADGT